jgi:hypothetical protein
MKQLRFLSCKLRKSNCIFQSSSETIVIGTVMANVFVEGIMRDETDLDRLRRQVEQSRILVQQTEVKVEELEASVRDIYNFKDRLVIFPRRANASALAE